MSLKYKVVLNSVLCRLPSFIWEIPRKGPTLHSPLTVMENIIALPHHFGRSETGHGQLYFIWLRLIKTQGFSVHQQSEVISRGRLSLCFVSHKRLHAYYATTKAVSPGKFVTNFPPFSGSKSEPYPLVMLCM